MYSVAEYIRIKINQPEDPNGENPAVFDKLLVSFKIFMNIAL